MFHYTVAEAKKQKRICRRILGVEFPDRTIRIVPIKTRHITHGWDYEIYAYDFFKQFGKVESTNIQFIKSSNPNELQYVLVQFEDSKIADNLIRKSRITMCDVEFEVTPLKRICKPDEGYSLSIVGGDLLYRCTFEVFQEYKNITLRSMKTFGTIRSLLRQKCSCTWQILYIGCTSASIISSSDSRETIKHFWVDFLMVLILVLLAKGHQSKYCNPGVDFGSLMAYSFYHGYVIHVVPSNSDPSSKGLKERIEDYEATQKVNFPIKKLFILQSQSLYIPDRLDSDYLENAKSLEVVKINRCGVVNRTYELSVYKIKGFEGLDWYVTAQGASSLLTYYEESKSSKHLDKYKIAVSRSFKERLEKLIWDDLRCRGLVEIIYYNDFNEHGDRVDVGLVLKKYVEDSLKNVAVNNRK